MWNHFSLSVEPISQPAAKAEAATLMLRSAGTNRQEGIVFAPVSRVVSGCEIVVGSGLVGIV
jgi:hypothetical protein